MDRDHEGGCLCGAVRYRIAAEPTSVAYCHCRMCQRAGGAPVMAWATVPADAFAFVRGKPATYASSTFAERQFCPRCGSPLTFRYRPETGEGDVTVASLDHPDALPPQYHIWTASRPAWFDTTDSLPRHRERGPDSPPPHPA